ncbi:MAG: hypothetical protein OXF02_05880 [Simkaniaceae bacterium]|nr:hypothetical protein [Simkaniaceae bacterium]
MSGISLIASAGRGGVSDSLATYEETSPPPLPDSLDPGGSPSRVSRVGTKFLGGAPDPSEFDPGVVITQHFPSEQFSPEDGSSVTHRVAVEKYSTSRDRDLEKGCVEHDRDPPHQPPPSASVMCRALAIGMAPLYVVAVVSGGVGGIVVGALASSGGEMRVPTAPLPIVLRDACVGGLAGGAMGAGVVTLSAFFLLCSFILPVLR